MTKEPLPSDCMLQVARYAFTNQSTSSDGVFIMNNSCTRKYYLNGGAGSGGGSFNGIYTILVYGYGRFKTISPSEQTPIFALWPITNLLPIPLLAQVAFIARVNSDPVAVDQEILLTWREISIINTATAVPCFGTGTEPCGSGFIPSTVVEAFNVTLHWRETGTTVSPNYFNVFKLMTPSVGPNSSSQGVTNWCLSFK